jgi:hypothetical protein
MGGHSGGGGNFFFKKKISKGVEEKSGGTVQVNK